MWHKVRKIIAFVGKIIADLGTKVSNIVNVANTAKVANVANMVRLSFQATTSASCGTMLYPLGQQHHRLPSQMQMCRKADILHFQ